MPVHILPQVLLQERTMQRDHKMQKGFTLIELVMVIVVLSIISLFTFSFLISNSRTYQIMKGQGELYQDGMYLMERISRDLIDSDTSCTGGFKRSHKSRDTNLCTQYTISGTTLFRNGKPIASNIISFTQPDYTTQPPYTISATLEKDCGMLPDKTGVVPKCKVVVGTSIYPKNRTDKFNGNYEIVIEPIEP